MSVELNDQPMTRAKVVLTDPKPSRLLPFACLSMCGLGNAIKVAAPSHVSLSFHFCQALLGLLMCRLFFLWF